MRFVYPGIEYEQKAIDFINEFQEISSETNGDGGLSGFLEKATYQNKVIIRQSE